MTTSEREVRPADRSGDNTAAAPDAGLSSREETRGDARQKEPLTSSVATAPDDSRQLELEIERTREQLGETVQELFARVDVMARARAKATEVSGKYKNTMVQARNQAATRAGRVRTQIAGNTTALRRKATSANKAQVRKAVTNGASGVQEHWLELAIALGVVSVSCLVAWQWVTHTSSATRYEIHA
jgi:hypothetical protein